MAGVLGRLRLLRLVRRQAAEDGTADRPASEAAVGEREVARGRHGSDRGGAAAGAATMCAISVARRGSRPGDAAQ
jgi:hypothetical protein